MANYISKLNVKGTEYLIKDTEARASISNMQSALNSVIRFKGISTTEITADGVQVPANIYATGTKPSLGDMVLYGKKEFVWITSKNESGTDTSHWVLLDALDAYGALASKNAVSVNSGGAHTHNVTIKTYAGAATTSTGSYTPEGTVTLTQTTDGTGVKPTVTFTKPTVTINGTATALTTTTIPTTKTASVNTGFAAGSLPKLTVTNKDIPNVTGVGTLPSLTNAAVDVLGSVKSAGSVPSLKKGDTAITSFSAISSVGSATTASVSGETLTITNGSAPTASSITFTAGSMPTFNSASVSKVSGWSAGTLPTLGTAISVGSASGWSAGTLPSASTTSVLAQDGDKTTTVATGAESVLTAVPTATVTGGSVSFANGLNVGFAGTKATISVTGTPKLTAADSTAATTSAGSHTHTVSYS